MRGRMRESGRCACGHVYHQIEDIDTAIRSQVAQLATPGFERGVRRTVVRSLAVARVGMDARFLGVDIQQAVTANA